MYFHLTCQGYPVIRHLKKVEILPIDKVKPIITINCEDALATRNKVFEKSDLLKNQIDLLFHADISKKYFQFAASKISKNRLL